MLWVHSNISNSKPYLEISDHLHNLQQDAMPAATVNLKHKSSSHNEDLRTWRGSTDQDIMPETDDSHKNIWREIKKDT